MIHDKRKQRTTNPPPAPVVTRRDHDGSYNVNSLRSGKTYSAQVQPDGQIDCGCPARSNCYHLPYIQLAHDLANLSDGDAVLVSEGNGRVWHTAIGADDTKVYTLEEPTGFRHAFVIRCERGERRVAA